MSGSSSSTSLGFSLPNVSEDTADVLSLGANETLRYLKGADKASSPNLQSPDALSGTPTRAQTNTTALQAQLAGEAAAAQYGSSLSAGASLNPSTTSRILLGS